MNSSDTVRPLVIAHRGFSSIAPENTIAALRAARLLGSQYSECDVRLTADGIPVLIHDESLLRTGGLNLKVSNVLSATLQDIDVGSWLSPTYAGEAVPTLAAALRETSDSMGLIIELKGTGMAAAVAGVIMKSNTALDKLILFSFDWTELISTQSMIPGIRGMWLVDHALAGRATIDQILDRAAAAGLSGVGVQSSLLDKAWLAGASRRSLYVFAWTVNTRDEMTRMAYLGVHGIISDKPDELIATLETIASSA
ncbi:MAG: glycerophosphodiester phosphodiesterase [Myxococcota bacterium]|nr:glycerophosphodiester phosphodiesterase [Myxococcota bacterium]